MSETQFFPDEMVRAHEIARILTVHPATVYRMARRQEIPYVKIGGQYLFPKNEILKRLKNSFAETMGDK